MSKAPPHPSEPDNSRAAGPAADALVNQEQERWLKRAVVAMTAVLIAGLFLLIGRVIYLARGSATQAVSANMAQPALLPQVRAVLPAGAEVKAISATGSRVVILHAAPGQKNEMSVLDLETGQIISRIAIDTAK